MNFIPMLFEEYVFEVGTIVKPCGSATMLAKPLKIA
jgi:hypothetical protein